MRTIQCNQHGMKFSIPTIDSEFQSGKHHQEVERCHLHHKQYPNCKFEEVREET